MSEGWPVLRLLKASDAVRNPQQRTLVMTVSSMMPPRSLVMTLSEPVPSARPATSPTTSDSMNGITSLPCNSRAGSKASVVAVCARGQPGGSTGQTRIRQRHERHKWRHTLCRTLHALKARLGGARAAKRTRMDMPHMCDTSKSTDSPRHCFVDSMIEALY